MSLACQNGWPVRPSIMLGLDGPWSPFSQRVIADKFDIQE